MAARCISSVSFKVPVYRLPTMNEVCYKVDIDYNQEKDMSVLDRVLQSILLLFERYIFKIAWRELPSQAFTMDKGLWLAYGSRKEYLLQKRASCIWYSITEYLGFFSWTLRSFSWPKDLLDALHAKVSWQRGNGLVPNWAMNSKHIGISSHISDAEEGYQESKFPTDLYEHLEGRNYCRKPDKKSYFLPCDDEEIDRLEINHLMFRWV